jgi:metallo-beta-lactamase family protein
MAASLSVRFFGAAENVTGSCTLVQAGGRRVLVDCGMYQERELRERNWQPFPVPAASIHAVLLTHAHLDHCGLLPKLASEGFRGRIHCTAATAEIARIVLLDSARIQEEDAAFKRRRHEEEGRSGRFPDLPLYTEEDAQACLPLFAPVRYGETVEIADGLSARFHEAGHILGSAMIELDVRGDGNARKPDPGNSGGRNHGGKPAGRRLIFSGDVGRWNKPIIRDPTIFEQGDYVFMESTYGDRLHEDPKAIADLLAEAVSSTRRAGGNLLIPSFALERTQEVLYYLNNLLAADRIPHLRVFVDSPMAVSVTEVFKDHPELFDADMAELMSNNQSPFHFPGLTMVRSVEESKSINQIRGTVIIIAGSGMCTGGRIKHHLVHNIDRKESMVLFVGYQARGTLGREILSGAKKVRILGHEWIRRARIGKISGFSAHADQGELLRWLAGFREAPRRLFLMHGEPDALKALSAAVRDHRGWRTTTARYGEEVTLD